MMPRLGPPYPGDGGTAGQAVIKREGLMWVLVVLAINAHTAFSIPGTSSEQTCSAKGKEIIAMLRHTETKAIHAVIARHRAPAAGRT